MGESGFERRRATRVAVNITVELRDRRGFSLHSTRDLSIGGVFFDRAIPHAVGERVQLSLQLPGDSRALRCDGEVVNVPNKQGYGMGVRFVTLSPGDQQRLEAFLDSIGGDETKVG